MIRRTVSPVERGPDQCVGMFGSTVGFEGEREERGTRKGDTGRERGSWLTRTM